MFNKNSYQQGEDGVWARPQSAGFAYSDGDENENRLLKILKSAKDVRVNSKELHQHQNDWPSIYHLSSLRGNLLGPLMDTMLPGKSILELGAGCGAITRFLGETGADVVAVEGSRRRASIISERCRDLPNVSVVSDLIQAFDSGERFDIVTLIGVLEYASVFFEGDDPVNQMLKLASSFLKPSGRFVVAIENKIGLKYFAGAPEDHTGLPMFGINNSYSNKTAVTFGRLELLNRIQHCGLKFVKLFIPLPDYKLPVSILCPPAFSPQISDLGWDPSPLLIGSVAFDAQTTFIPSFSTEMAWQSISENGLAQELANSFLFVASPQSFELGDDILATHYGAWRPAMFARETQFLASENKIVVRRRPSAKKAAQNDTPWKYSEYVQGTFWFAEMVRAMNIPGWTINSLAEWAKTWIAELQRHILQDCGNDMPQFQLFSHFLPGNYIDATPFNLIIDKNGMGHFFDLKWDFGSAIPIQLVILRGLYIAMTRITFCAKPHQDVPINILNISADVMRTLGYPIEDEETKLLISVITKFHNQVSGIIGTQNNEATASRIYNSQLFLR